MSNNSESGHATNMANLNTLISTVIAFGEVYNPSKDSIKVPALQTLQTNATIASNLLTTALTNYSYAVDAREQGFKELNKIVTRAYNSLKASASSTLNDESVLSIVRKLQGRRASAKLTPDELKTLETEGKEQKQISTSQMSYESRLDNFNKFISMLEAIPEYNPNEEDLKIASLKNLLVALLAKNNDHMVANIQLTNARSERNNVFYLPLVGLVDIATDVKTYVKSIDGVSGTKYKQISKLKFLNKL